MSEQKHSDEGLLSVEVALISACVVMLATTCAVLGQAGRTRLAIDVAAQDAARAATLQHDRAAARLVAQRRAVEGIDELPCERTDVSVDLTGFRPGGAVSVAVGCELRLRLGVVGPTIARRMRADAVAPVDTFRGDG